MSRGCDNMSEWSPAACAARPHCELLQSVQALPGASRTALLADATPG